jgi:magnesium transporter
VLRPEPDEVAFVKRTSGLDVPSIGDLSEIESSSRLRNQNGAIYLSAPLIYRADSDQPLATPVGFVLTRERLITVRFEELSSFTTFAHRDLAAESDPLTTAAVFAGLMDAIADRLADILENIAAELDALSHRLFSASATEPAARRRRHVKAPISGSSCGASAAAEISLRRSATVCSGSGALCRTSRMSPPIGCRLKSSRDSTRCARTSCR